MHIAVLLFGVRGVSLYEGVIHWLNPRPLEDPRWAYAVLGVAAVLEGVSWWFALREVLAGAGDHGVWAAIRRSYDPSTFTVLLEDSAALIGIAAAFIGITAAHRLRDPRFDGAASIVIGATLCLVALLLIRESKGASRRRGGQAGGGGEPARARRRGPRDQ